MATVYITGDPTDEGQKRALREEAFDAFMLKTAIEQRRFLRKFGFSESEIDEVLQDPAALIWEFRPD